MKTWWLLSFALMMIPGLVLSATVKENVDYKGWNCVVMENDDTAVILAPQLAGRIIQYRTGDKEWLWNNEALAGSVAVVEPKMNMENWVNYGGDKLWPAPQGWDGSPGKWPGPGDNVLDLPWTYQVLKASGQEISVEMTSSGQDKGGWAGIQYRRIITLHDGSNKVDLQTFMKNITDHDVAWGIWSVTQMDFADQNGKQGKEDWNEDAYLAIPMNENSRWPERFQVMFGLASSFNWQPDYVNNLLIVRYMNFVGKIVIDVAKGWAAMVDPAAGYTYVQRFDYDPKAVYPDGGNFEAWVAGKGEFVHDNKRRMAADDAKGRLIEMEIMAPKVTLKPGQETSMKSSWQVYQGGLDAVPEYKKGR